MQKSKLVIIVCITAFTLFRAAHGETLAVTDSMIISAQNADFLSDSANAFAINGIYVSDDIVYAACNQGIIAGYRGNGRWRVVAGSEEYLAVWKDKMSAAGQYGHFHPSKIWKMPSGELGIFDYWLICRFYALNPDAPPRQRLRPLKNFDENSIVETFNVGKDIILCGLYSIYHNSMIGILNTDLAGYRRIFDIPTQLRRDLDSMGADYNPQAALNPKDGTFWVAFDNYNVIYIVDRKGKVVDSVSIIHPDFVLPRPPASRIKSEAVFQDWYSKCASIYSLQYATPGYFLLRFTGPRKIEADPKSRSAFLLCWNADAKPVDLAVNPEWILSQVQADGTIPFVAYDRKNGVVTRAVIYLTRIMP